jgi:hypothetical protein
MQPVSTASGSVEDLALAVARLVCESHTTLNPTIVPPSTPYTYSTAMEEAALSFLHLCLGVAMAAPKA